MVVCPAEKGIKFGSPLAFFFMGCGGFKASLFCVCSLNFLDVMIVGFEFVVAIFAVGDVYEQMGVLFT